MSAGAGTVSDLSLPESDPDDSRMSQQAVDDSELKEKLKIGYAFAQRYRDAGDLNDLEAAVQNFQEVVDLTPRHHPTRAQRLANLAVSYTDRYWRLGDLKDLHYALQRNHDAVDLTPVDHPERAERLKNLAVSFTDLYRRLGHLADLEAALQINKEVVDLTPADHLDRAARLQGLAVCFTYRYQRLGDLMALEAALRKFQEAVDLTAAEHPQRAKRLQSLAGAFTLRFRRLGDLADLEAALQRNQEAVDLTSANQSDRATQLQSLAASFIDRYHRLGDLKDLEAALHRDKEAVDLTPEDHPIRAELLKNLAAAFGDRYLRCGDLKDLEAALEIYQKAVDMTPPDHPDRAGRLHSLAIALTDRYQRLGYLGDLEAALYISQEALALTPADHPGRAGQLQSLAMSVAGKYQGFQEPEDLQHVHTLYRDSFETQSLSNPEESWIAALKWASFSEEFEPARCSEAYSAAFNLLPELLWMAHTIPDRHDTVYRLHIEEITSVATRTCIKLFDLISAVQLVEQGLATTFQQILQLKTDFNVLPPEQAKTLQRLSFELYSGTTEFRVARERRQLLEDIRKQPGHKYFLKPKPYSVLRRVSRGGPVVILNSHKDGCDGIIILNPTSDPVHIVLPNVTLELLKSQQTVLKQLLGRCNVRTRGDSVSTRLFGGRQGFTSKTIEESFEDMLSWLYKNVVDPVYQLLASNGVHNGRLWWLPTGSFTGLPLHACAPTNQFIHSYTATLGSLLEAQDKKPSMKPYKVGVVGVTHTGLGRMNYLQGVKQEVQNICSIIQSSNLECLNGQQATPDAVKDQLQNCSWVHLACHGIQDLVEPTKSRLLLYDGVLELETILRMPLTNAEFVFLAACQTAKGDVALINESFHLGGGFIAAGFRGAIGTLWSMNDEDGPLVAESVYSHLFQDGRQPQASDAAGALQVAVDRLRAQKVGYERWIPFIHMGV
ncbi:CHAT domain-containing protein [Mycena capillaripes]|nr:CHAT domain-containing protein [Mycena capillaripes]